MRHARSLAEPHVQNARAMPNILLQITIEKAAQSGERA
jgi:hypothetical protein